MASTLTIDQMNTEFSGFLTRLETILQNTASKRGLGIEDIANLAPATRRSGQDTANHREVLTPAVLHYVLQEGIIAAFNEHADTTNPHGLVAADLDAWTDEQITTYVENWVSQEIGKLVIPTYQEIDATAVETTRIALDNLAQRLENAN